MFVIVVDNLSLIGLGCSFIGAIVTLIPSVSSVDQYLTDTSQIKNLSIAHTNLLKNETLTPSESGFSEINELLERHAPVDQTPDRLNAPPTGAWGGGGFIEREYDGDGNDEIIGSQVLVNRWVTEEIVSSRATGERRMLYISMLLIATGFALQVVASLL